jgi:hypothetical protein
MLTINFYPENNDKKYIKTVKEYETIWKNDGKNILDLIEKYSTMKFKTKIINAIICSDTISQSVPMILDDNLNYVHKKTTLVHELIHRLLYDHDYWIWADVNYVEELHKIVDLILFDILSDLYGIKVAKDNVKHEISYGDIDYKNAWEWTLNLTKDDRKIKFKEMKLKYKNKKTN